MLNDVAFRPFTKQPAGENAAPVIGCMFEHQQLEEGTGFLRAFPLCRPLASAQTDDSATDPDALTGAQRNIPNKAIALVE
jgi:hypothetical protein